MTIEFDMTNPGAFEEIAMAAYERATIPVQDAMAQEFARITRNNFGFQGEDRPKEWPMLSEKYAREFHDGEQTPTLWLHGDLHDSIFEVLGIRDASEVATVNEYASAHQWGVSGRLHARPFFPIHVTGDATPYTFEKVIQAGQNALDGI